MYLINDISKNFPGVKALASVSFELKFGEVHALVGENGAGKSTLIKILGGVFPQDSGQIIFDNQPVHFKNTHQSQQCEISVIYQEFNLMPDLTVAENVFVGREPTKGVFLNWQQMVRDTKHIMNFLGVDVDPKSMVENLSVAQKQMVEIAKALSFKARLIIMDEPTAALSDTEVEKLFEVTRTLKQQGTTILFVSHRLKEVFVIADRITVLRDGKFVATKIASQTDESEIVQLMVGRDIESKKHHVSSHDTKAVLTVKQASLNSIFSDISFQANRGEIIGIAGLMGSGRKQLAEALYGLLPLDKGQILIEDRLVNIKNPQQAISYGISFLAEDRKTDSIFAELSVKQNFSMTIIKRLTRWGGSFISFQQEEDAFNDYTDRLDIRYSDPAQQIVYLSGGNQQKVLLARALASDCRLLILCEPTRGVDVAAKAEIHTFIRQLTDKGVAVLMISSELPEIISTCDRCLVMYQGKITGRLEKDDMTETNIIACAIGRQAIGV